MLTQKEREVAALVAHCLTNKVIAAKLHISVSTVRTHVAAIAWKIGVRDGETVERVRIARFWWELEHVEAGVSCPPDAYRSRLDDLPIPTAA